MVNLAWPSPSMKKAAGNIVTDVSNMNPQAGLEGRLPIHLRNDSNDSMNQCCQNQPNLRI